MSNSPCILASLILALSFQTAEAQDQIPSQSQGSSGTLSAGSDAQEPIQDTLKRVEGKIDAISNSTEKVQKVVADEPLAGKKFGVEFNLLRPLIWSGNEQTLSGTFSVFDVSKKVEYAFPVMISSADQTDSWRGQKGSLDTLTMDFHYRKFLGHTMNGFYLSAFTRATYLNGLLESDGFTAATESSKEFKLGVGFGVGYRIFSSSNFYWGSSISVGRNLVGDSEIYADADGVSANLDDEETIVDVEFFKFGYSF